MVYSRIALATAAHRELRIGFEYWHDSGKGNLSLLHLDNSTDWQRTWLVILVLCSDTILSWERVLILGAGEVGAQLADTSECV
jgi:hypothetical protein